MLLVERRRFCLGHARNGVPPTWRPWKSQFAPGPLNGPEYHSRGGSCGLRGSVIATTVATFDATAFRVEGLFTRLLRAGPPRHGTSNIEHPRSEEHTSEL